MRICACRSDEHPQRYTIETRYIPPNKHKAIAEPRALSQPTKRTHPGSKATRTESYACPNTRVNFDRKASYFFTYKGKRATQDRFKGQTKDISTILTLLKFTESLLIACKILSSWVKGLVISLSVYIVSAFFQQHLCTDHFPKRSSGLLYHSLHAATKCTDYEWYYNNLTPRSSFWKFKCELSVFHSFLIPLHFNAFFSSGHAILQIDKSRPLGAILTKPPGAKARIQGGGKVLVQIPGGAQGDGYG